MFFRVSHGYKRCETCFVVILVVFFDVASIYNYYVELACFSNNNKNSINIHVIILTGFCSFPSENVGLSDRKQIFLLNT